MNTEQIKFKDVEKLLAEQFDFVDEVRDFNQKKVLDAFVENRVAAEHFMTVSG